jgi:hypothetical protein
MKETTSQLLILFHYLAGLLKNPILQIRTLPEIEWKTLIIFQFCLTLTSVVISNLLAPFAISLINVLISLCAAILALGLASLFFYYYFQIVYNRTLKFIRIFTLVLFAHIPFAIFHLAAYFFPPADLIGIGLSAALMIVGLVDNFAVPKKIAIQLMIVLYSVFLVYWVTHLIFRPYAHLSTTPEDLDKLEKEIHKSLKQ